MPEIKMNSDDRLRLLGLWMLATDYYAQAREVERAMRRMIGDAAFDSGLGDSIYAHDGPYQPRHFDSALREAGIVIVDNPKD